MNSLTESIVQTQCEYDRERVFKPELAMYRAGCKACAIAELAAGPLFHHGGLDGMFAKEYRKRLGQIFGDDFRAGHQLVAKQHEAQRLARKVREAAEQ